MSTMTLNLDDKHTAVLEELAARHEMSKSQVLRQALRLYQLVDNRIKAGEELAFTCNGEIVHTYIVGLSGHD